LPLPEHAYNQTPHGIGRLPEQTLQNKSRIGDDRGLGQYDAMLCGQSGQVAWLIAARRGISTIRSKYTAASWLACAMHFRY